MMMMCVCVFDYFTSRVIVPLFISSCFCCSQTAVDADVALSYPVAEKASDRREVDVRHSC